MKKTFSQLKSLIIILIIMLGLDIIYLTTFKTFFNNIVNEIQGSDIKLKMLGALLTYILMGFSLYYFIVIKNSSNMDAFLLGMFIYGVFELTNYSIFLKWPLKAVVLELLWGGLLYFITFAIYKKTIN
jgi:uncharacterized membrane protein